MYTFLRNSLACLLSLWLVSSAWAAPIENLRSSTVTLKSGDGHLQNILNGLFQSGAPNATSGQSNVGSFRPTQFTAFTFLDAKAGYRATNRVGIYQVLDSSGQIGFMTNLFEGGVPNGSEVVGMFSSSAVMNDFGLFLEVYQASGSSSDLDYIMYTDDRLNPGSLPQTVVYFGSGQAFKDNSIGVDGIFDEDDIIIAFEDLHRKNGVSDDDFNDLILLIENIDLGQPVPDPDFKVTLPEPASMAVWSLLAALGGVVGWRRGRVTRV